MSTLPAEVVGNLAANWRRHFVVTLLVGAIVGSVCAAESAAAASAIDLGRRLDRGGRNVFVATSPDASGGPVVSAARCDALNGRTGIVAAGGLLSMPVTDSAEAPGTPLRPYGSTGRVAAVLDPALRDRPANRAAALISSALAHQLGVRDSERITIAGHSAAVEWFNPSPRHPLADLIVLVPVAGQVVDECWFEVDPPATALAVSIGVAALSSPAQPVIVRPALPETEFSEDPLKQFERRTTRWIWTAAALALSLPVIIGAWLSRSTLALYRSLGAGRALATAILLGESVWILFAGGGLGLGVALTTLSGRPGFGLTAWHAGLRATWLALGGSCTLAVAVIGALARGSVVEQLRDR